jgi:hypothetical protein
MTPGGLPPVIQLFLKASVRGAGFVNPACVQNGQFNCLAEDASHLLAIQEPKGAPGVFGCRALSRE